MNICNLIKKRGSAATLFTLVAGVACWSHQASALTCKLVPNLGVMNYTIPLQAGNLNVGPDVSNGTIIYRQYYKPSRETQISCEGNSIAYQPTVSWYYSNSPNPVSTWSDGTFSAGKVYETGVPGVGIAIYTYNKPARYTVPFDYMPWQKDYSTTAILWRAQGGFEFDIVLIKTGNISPGTLSGAQLPTVKYDFKAQDLAAINLGSLNFSGAINIVSQTCQTPDVTVSMGTYDTGEYFTGVGKTTEWKDATIKLINCPRFYGTLNDGRNTWNSDNGTSSTGTITNNVLNLTLSPNTSIIDSAKGILGLKTGADSASGVGIQMAYGYTSNASPTLVDFNNSKNYTMLNNEATTQSMPLIARYIQTDSNVTAGKADATVTFTISYY